MVLEEDHPEESKSLNYLLPGFNLLTPSQGVGSQYGRTIKSNGKITRPEKQHCQKQSCLGQGGTWKYGKLMKKEPSSEKGKGLKERTTEVSA